MFLRTGFARIRLGERFEFITGDRYLQNVDVILDEQKRSSSCTFTIYDPDLVVFNFLFTNFQVKGGIYVPKGLLDQPPPVSQIPGASATTTGGKVTGASNVTGSLRGDALAQEIIKECVKQGVTMREQIAYVCATVQRETDMGRIMVEQGSRTYFNYLEGRRDIGNTRPGDGYKYRG